jgi:poly(3-hydroxybutyrate) depolymerase
MLSFAALAASLWVPTAFAQVNCNVDSCDAIHQQTIKGFKMFNDSNFDPIVDGFGRTRRFWVHLPDDYDDVVDDETEKIPVIFAFHGGGQRREAMVAGKWGAYFDQNIAFVIPQGEPDPCHNSLAATHWMQPTFGPSTSDSDPNCDPATQVVKASGTTITYWNASLPGTFTDVRFVEQLRAMLLGAFPKLNANKVYATGFSSGGGMTLSLLCYRSNLFRGFSVVAQTLANEAARGDYDSDGVVETDPQSLAATCGKSLYDTGHATGIAWPRLWGYGVLLPPVVPHGPTVYARITKPVALFVGDQDKTMQEINDTGALVRTRNNLSGVFWLLDPFSDTAIDDATTQRRTFVTPLNSLQSYSTFRRFLVRGIAFHSATHAMPDAEECASPAGPGNPSPHYGPYFNTCDFSYTTQTKIFFEEHANLNLNP